MPDKENLKLIWSYTDEPHLSRRRKILEKHPEIKSLMTTDKNIALHVAYEVVAQVVMCFAISFLMNSYSPYTMLLHPFENRFMWLKFILIAYAIGGTINHSLTLSIHEISHNTIFGNDRAALNRAFGMFANLPIGVPMASTFKKYHVDHHRYLGDEILDGDVTTPFEIAYFSSTFGKILFIIFQPLFYAFRPFYLNPKPLTFQEVINYIVQFSFNFIIFKMCGVWAVIYLISSTLLGLGMHPISGHFFAEHYLFYPGVDTCSYYGILNSITYNVGYHVEHHDFPNIPCYNLPKVRKMAPEFYDNLPFHTSWVYVLYSFITRPDMGPASRIRRSTKINLIKEN
ncbi:hypothetical protein GJ496_011034 [Pomphorhynchus laevis]|nr:hypothetical protein GJ496_011034 [Pomphorhynchus laevis]